MFRDSELLNEYSKRFAFVVHDIKNLASQLGLVAQMQNGTSMTPTFSKICFKQSRTQSPE